MKMTQYIKRAAGHAGFFPALLGLLTLTMPNLAKAQESLFFASDIHDCYGKLSEIINCTGGALCETGIETVGLVGDFDTREAERIYDSTWDEDVKAIVSEIPTPINLVMARGNHDLTIVNHDDVFFTGAVNLPAHPISVDTTVPELADNNYAMFTIDVNDFGETSIPDQISAFAAANPYKVLFILSHYPLHSLRWDLVPLKSSAEAIFNRLNELGQQHDIVFLWGHNHRDTDLNANVRKVAVPTQTIAETASTEYDLINNTVAHTSLTFTYMSPGFLKGEGADLCGDTPISYSVVDIYDNEVEIIRYDSTPITVSIDRKPPLIGDVNMDGAVNIVDALLIAQYYVGEDMSGKTFHPELADTADAGDGAVNIVDALIIARYYVGLETELPVVAQGNTGNTSSITTMAEASAAISAAMNQ
jgi:hypothetical protein